MVCGTDCILPKLDTVADVNASLKLFCTILCKM